MKTLDTIKKLLKLANDSGATEGEVQAALGRAAALAAKHNVSDVEIEKAVREDGSSGVRISVDAGDMVREVVFSKGQLFRWDKWLCGAIATATCTGHYLGWDAEKGRPGLYLYGLAEDVAVGRELFAFAREAMARCARNWAREQRLAGFEDVQGNHPSVRTYKDGFCTGLRAAAQVGVAGDKVEIAVGGTDCTALVLVEDLVEAKQAALVVKSEALGLKMGRSLGGNVGGGGAEAYGAGKSAGKATSLRRDVIR